MGLFDDLFGDLFDYNGDGKTTWDEEWIAYNIFKNIQKKSEESENPDSDSLFNDDDDDDDLSSELNDSDSWRESCEDSSEFDISPENYETGNEYNNALEEARYSWREYRIDGIDVGIFPENYETEDEYNDALEEARYSWRESCEDGSEFDVDPEDFETEVEYNDALEEARYSWRESCEDGSEFDISPENYETEVEYNDALEEARYSWRESCEDGNEKVDEIETHSEKPPFQTAQSVFDDKNIYLYCGVVFKQSSHVYYFRTDDNTLKIGDSVIVPVSVDLIETEAAIVSVGQYTRVSVPFPLEKTRFIIKKVESN